MSPVRPLDVDGFLVRSRDQSVRVHADSLERLLELFEGSLVELDQREEPDGRATDDGQHEREAVAGGADHRLRAAADANPDGQMSVGERRTHVLVGERRAELARPRDGLVSQKPH